MSVPSLDALPAELAGELTALALKLQMNIPQTWAALIDIGIAQKLLRMRVDERAAVLVSMTRVDCAKTTTTHRNSASAKARPQRLGARTH